MLIIVLFTSDYLSYCFSFAVNWWFSIKLSNTWESISHLAWYFPGFSDSTKITRCHHHGSDRIGQIYFSQYLLCLRHCNRNTTSVSQFHWDTHTIFLLPAHVSVSLHIPVVLSVADQFKKCVSVSKREKTKHLYMQVQWTFAPQGGGIT